MYTDLCVPLNQLDSICVQVILPNNNVLMANFALWDTILDVKYYILSALQPTIENAQHIKCLIFNTHQQFEASNHMLLKNVWNNCCIKIMIKITRYRDMLKDIKNQDNMMYLKYENVNNINFMPKKTLGYRNKTTGKLYTNSMVQTISKTPNLESKNKNSLSIQTIRTSDATTENSVEFGTQTEAISELQALNNTKEISKNQTTK